MYIEKLCWLKDKMNLNKQKKYVLEWENLIS